MWISQAAWLKTREEFITLQAERNEAVKKAEQQEVTLGWFMHRLTQVEHERSKLIFNFTGVKVDAPTYEQAAPEPTAADLHKNPLNSIPSFADVGDVEAAKLGIDWDEEGAVVYGVTK